MIQVKKAVSSSQLKDIYHIRKIVFIEEQQCPPELEWEDEEEAVHFLASFNNVPAGTARWLKTENGYKLQRFAVLKEFRTKGVGQALVKFILEDLPLEAKFVYLHSQAHACSFYSNFGFVTEGDEFMEAGIRHYKMILNRK